MSETTPAPATPPTADTPQPPRAGVPLVLSALLLTLFLSALDQTVVATALPAIVSQLHGLSHLSWVVTAYTLAAGVSMPLYGKLGDLYGRKGLFLLATVLFLVGSGLSGLAGSMPQLAAFRGVQGLGAGGLMVLAMAIVADVTTPRQRGRYMGLFGAVFGVASLTGPFVGGFLTDHLSWRWVFWVNLPVGAVALAVSAAKLHLPGRSSSHRIDYLGAVLLTGALGCATLVTAWGGERYAWSAAPTVALVLGGVVLLTAFVLVERRAAEPLIPPRLFGNRTFVLCCVATVLVGTALLAGATYLPLFLQFASGASATSAGLLLFPMMAGMILSSTVGGRWITRLGRYKWAPVLGCCLATLAAVLLGTMDAGTGRFLSGCYMALLGLGIGLTTQPLMLALQTNAAPADLGAATSTATFAQRIGGSLGLTALGALFNARLASSLTAELPDGQTARLPAADSLSPRTVAALPVDVREAVQSAFAHTLSEVFWWMAPLLAAGIALSLALRNVRLDDAAPQSAPQPSDPTDQLGARPGHSAEKP